MYKDGQKEAHEYEAQMNERKKERKEGRKKEKEEVWPSLRKATLAAA